jgi:Mrp family chromosome partitioning ATPase
MRTLVDGAIIVLRPADLGTGRYERTLDRLQGLPVAGILLNGAGEATLEV